MVVGIGHEPGRKIFRNERVLFIGKAESVLEMSMEEKKKILCFLS